MEYKKRFMLYEIWDQAKVNSDKNKKGGYDHIASAATNFIAVFDAIEKDYNANKFNKQWTKEYQEQLNTSLKVWEALSCSWYSFVHCLLNLFALSSGQKNTKNNSILH